MKKAYTLLEIIIVIAIVLIITAVLAAVFSSAKVQAKHTVCASQMKQLYMALAQYSSDNDAESLFPELHGHAYFTGDVLFEGVLAEYRTILKCPSMTPKLKSAMYSAYQFTGLLFPKPTSGPMGPGVDSVKIAIELEKKLGADIPIVECPMHDETEFQPSEGKKGVPWMQWINSQGSLKKGRADWRERMTMEEMVK